MFNVAKKKLNKLVDSDRYKNSKYKVQKVNGAFGLKHKSSGTYVDLCNNSYKWEYGSVYTKDCFGNRWDVMEAFNFLCPIIEPLSIEKEY